VLTARATDGEMAVDRGRVTESRRAPGRGNSAALLRPLLSLRHGRRKWQSRGWTATGLGQSSRGGEAVESHQAVLVRLRAGVSPGRAPRARSQGRTLERGSCPWFRRHGRGYRAPHTRLGRDIALKVVNEPLAGDPELVRCFEQETRLGGSLNHPNVVAVYDVGLHEGSPRAGDHGPLAGKVATVPVSPSAATRTSAR